MPNARARARAVMIASNLVRQSCIALFPSSGVGQCGDRLVANVNFQRRLPIIALLRKCTLRVDPMPPHEQTTTSVTLKLGPKKEIARWPSACLPLKGAR